MVWVGWGRVGSGWVGPGRVGSARAVMRGCDTRALCRDQRADQCASSADEPPAQLQHNQQPTQPSDGPARRNHPICDFTSETRCRAAAADLRPCADQSAVGTRLVACTAAVLCAYGAAGRPLRAYASWDRQTDGSLTAAGGGGAVVGRRFNVRSDLSSCCRLVLQRARAQLYTTLNVHI